MDFLLTSLSGALPWALAALFAITAWTVSKYHSAKATNREQDRRIKDLEEWQKRHDEDTRSLTKQFQDFRIEIAGFHAEERERLVRLETILLNGKRD